MITSVQGRLIAAEGDYVVITVSGVGLKIYVPHSTRERLREHEEAFLHTQLILRSGNTGEITAGLYGFATIAEREMFETLLNVSGVGPRLALAMLSALSIDALRNAVLSERPEILERVPGIGKKTAQKIALELKDKLPAGLDAAPMAGFDDLNSDVLDALVALGYSIVEAQTAIQSLPLDAPKDVETRVRLALQFFL